MKRIPDFCEIFFPVRRQRGQINGPEGGAGQVIFMTSNWMIFCRSVFQAADFWK
jgi:hypothetical protein